MEFEWDEAKRTALLRWRDIDLLHAARIFEGPVLTTLDTRHDYGEERYVSIGKVEEEYFVVVHTPRQDAVCLITTRRAGARLRREHRARHP